MGSTMPGAPLELKSKKAKAWILFLVLWVALAGGFFAVVGVNYAGYREIQDAGVALMQVAAPSEYSSEDRAEVVRDIYYDLTRTSVFGESVADVTADLRDSLEEALEDLGYDVGYVPEYFRYSDFSGYLVSWICLEISPLPPLIFYAAAVVLLVFTILYLANAGGSVTVGAEAVTCQKNKGHTMQLLYRDVISAKTTGLGGLTIVGPGARFSTKFLTNGPALRMAIMEKKMALSREAEAAGRAPAPAVPIPGKAPVPMSDATEQLKKYKELLDTGVITQEEFDAKKKQLLGL